MKKVLAIVAVSAFVLGSCQVQTCPTYSKKDVKPVEKTTQNDQERV